MGEREGRSLSLSLAALQERRIPVLHDPHIAVMLGDPARRTI